MTQYVAAIDQGTTSTRCIIFSHDGTPLGSHQMEHEQIYPQPGWVEHDAMEIWRNTQTVVRGALENSHLTSESLAAVGITNQRETTVVWDKNTGEPLFNAVVWMDTRTDKIVSELSQHGGQDLSLIHI